MRRSFIAALLVGSLLGPINTTMISVALTPISEALGVGSATVLWLIVALYLAMAIAQPTMGVLADRFGPRRIYLAGFAIVIVGSALPLASPTFGALLAARILLGIGVSAAYPSALGMIRRETARLGIPTPPSLLASLSVVGLGSAALGPVLGGGLILVAGWQGIFTVNIPLALVAGVLGAAWLPKDATADRPRGILASLDLPGFALFTLAVTALLFFLLDLRAQLWWLLAAFAVLAAALVLWSLRRADPFIDVRLLARNGALSRTYLRLGLTFLGPYIGVYGVSQWLQHDAGLTSAEAGLAQFPSLLLAGIASLVVARTVRVRLPLVVTAVVTLVGGLLLAVADSAAPVWPVVLAVALFGIPQGLASVSNQVVVYRVSPPEQIGAASGLSRTAISLTAIVTSSIIGVVFGDAPSDAGLNVMGWILVGASAVALVLSLADRALRDGSALD